jgi:hypothetical protein
MDTLLNENAAGGTMRGQVKLLSLTVWITVWLLGIAAMLVVLGVFNQQLRWDIFSPQVEAALYGIFFSAVLLSVFGVAIAFVLGLKRIVDAVEALERRGKIDATLPVSQTRPLTYAGYMLGLFSAFAALIGVLGFVDYRVQVHRSEVFKRIATEQLQRLDQRLVQPLSQVRGTPINAKTHPKSLRYVMNALRELPFVQDATLYIADPKDIGVLWRYSGNYFGDPKSEPVFQRFLVVKQFEAAIQQSLQGQPQALATLNQQSNLTWYHMVKAQNGTPLAVLKIVGNPNENLREYRLSSSAL